MKQFMQLLKRIHNDEKGAVSIETVLIIAAVAIPILIFIVLYGWPAVRDFFWQNMDALEEGSNDMMNDGGGGTGIN